MAIRKMTEKLTAFLTAEMAAGRLTIADIHGMSIKEIEDAERRANPPPVEMEACHFVVLGYTTTGKVRILSTKAVQAPKGAMGRRGHAGKPPLGWSEANDAFRSAWVAFCEANPPGSQCVAVFPADCESSDDDTAEG